MAMIRLLAAAVIVLGSAAGAPGTAHAAAGAEARIVDITYTLVDLDPTDGIAPAFSVVNDPMVNRLRTELTVDVANSLLGTSDNAINANFSFIAPLSLDRAVVGNQAHATASPTDVSAWVLSEAKGHASAFSSAVSNLLFTGDFGLQLTPHTSITISADAIVKAFDTGAPGPEGIEPFEHAQAESWIRIQAGDPGDGSGPQDELSMFVAQTNADAAADTVDGSGAMSVSFSNLSAAPLFGYLSMRSTADAFGVTPVPEPPAWALALVGLAGLTLLRRHRARRLR
jgi:MYXO-CTERM domain-containing protein